MHNAVYLHGRGQLNPEKCNVYKKFSNILKNKKILLTPIAYTQDLDIDNKYISDVFNIVSNKIIELSQKKKIILIGYSFGGLLASWFAEKYPNFIYKLILLAPAIDNYERNYQNIKNPKYTKYINDLRTLNSRPILSKDVCINTLIIHGTNDNDLYGSNLSRIISWVKKLKNIKLTYYPENVDHSLMPWLYRDSNNISKKMKSIDQLLDILL